MTVGLQPGDVAITCVNTAGADFFQITPLLPIDSDTEIRYTDRETTAAGQFNTGEAVNVLLPLNPTDAGVSTIPAGTPILIGPTAVFGLATVMDQIFLYQGLIGDPSADAGFLTGGQFLWGFQSSPPGLWFPVRDDANNLSERLTVLNGKDTAVASGPAGAVNVMFFYSGPTAGTKAELQVAIANPANWTGSPVTIPGLCPGPFVVLPPSGSGTGGTPDTGTGGTADTGEGGSGEGGTGEGGSGAGGSGAGGSGEGGSGAGTVGLQPGDVAITCVNTAGADFFQITPLLPIDSDTEIRYTDRETTAAGQFNTGEAVNILLPLNPTDAGVATIPAGTPILIGAPAVLGLATVMDQIFLYQGQIGDPSADAGFLTGGQFLWGFQSSPPGLWFPIRDDANNLSERLTVLNGNDTAVASGPAGAVNVMFFYSGPTAGTKAELQVAIANPANWTGSPVTIPGLCPGPLVVLPPSGSGTGGTPDTGTGGTADMGEGGSGAGGSGVGGTGEGGSGPGGSGAGGSGEGGMVATGAGGAKNEDHDHRHHHDDHHDDR